MPWWTDAGARRLGDRPSLATSSAEIGVDLSAGHLGRSCERFDSAPLPAQMSTGAPTLPLASEGTIERARLEFSFINSP